MKPKEFFKRWKQGMKEITLLQQVHAKMVGHVGAIIGLSIALTTLIYRVIINFNWLQTGFAIFLFFIIWLQAVEYIGTRQKYKGMKEMMEQIEENQGVK